MQADKKWIGKICFEKIMRYVYLVKEFKFYPNFCLYSLSTIEFLLN